MDSGVLTTRNEGRDAVAMRLIELDRLAGEVDELVEEVRPSESAGLGALGIAG
jgi:hypothetical protein